jgi:hypothetical protein
MTSQLSRPTVTATACRQVKVNDDKVGDDLISDERK